MIRKNVFTGLLLLPAPLLAQAIPPVYQPFQPLKEDGYAQAWNINFSGQGYHIDLIYMISNVGPGTLNNGISLLVYSNEGNRAFTAEHTDETLRAAVGEFGMKNASGELKLVDGRIEALASFNQASIQLVMQQPGSTGMLMPEWNLSDGEFFRIGLPVLQSPARLTLKMDGRTLELTGLAGMDSIISNTLPHRYAKRLYLFRSPSGQFQMTGYLDKEQSYRLRLYYGTGAGQREDRIVQLSAEEEETEPFSGYRLARVWKIRGESGCSYEIRRGEFRGGMYILQSVSPFLRWILRAFFAKPFILNYESTLSVQCAKKPAFTEKLRASYFLLNE